MRGGYTSFLPVKEIYLLIISDSQKKYNGYITRLFVISNKVKHKETYSYERYKKK